MATKAMKIGLSDADKLAMINNIKSQTLSTLIPAYSTSIEYSIGQYVVYNGVLYRCIGTTTGAWDSTKWESATLEDLVDDVNGAVADVAHKASIDGYYATMGVGHADSALSLDTSIGVDDQTPFNYQTAGGTSDITTGIQNLKKLVGASVVFNQLMDSDTDTEKTENGVTTTLVNGKYTMSGTATANTFGVVTKRVNLISRHKYLFYIEQTGTEQSGTTWQIYADAIALYAPNTCIFNPNYNGEINFMIAFYANAVINASFYLELFDLTQMFGSQVADYLYNLTNNGGVTIFKSMFPNDYYEYNLGTFIHSQSAKLKMVDYNQWDEEWEVSGIVSGTLNSKNYIEVIPNATYYYYCSATSSGNCDMYFYDKDKNQIGSPSGKYNQSFTIPSNCRFIRFRMSGGYGTTYNNDICISLYWDGSRTGYEPYQEHIYDLPNDELKGILKVVNNKIVADGDEEYPDGTKKTRYGIVDLGSLTWDYEATQKRFYCDLNDGLFPSAYNVKATLLIANYTVVSFNELVTDDTKDKSCAALDYAPTRKLFSIRDLRYTDATTFKAAMNGVYLVYELAEPTETTSTAFAENIYVDDFGTMEFLDENNARINGIQGNEIFYKANISGFAESLYVKTDGDVDNITTTEELTTETTARTSQDTILQNAIGGTLRQCLCVKESLDFDNTNVVDLGTLSWTRTTVQGGTNYGFVAQVTDMKYSTSGSSTPKILCSAYKTGAPDNTYLGNNKTISTYTNIAYLSLIDNSYTDATTFKNAMKGVLLAYEKSSS